MMVPNIITHAVSVVAQNKKVRVRALGRRARSKSKRDSPSASLSGSSTNVPATLSQKRSRTAQSICTQGYVAHFRKNHHRLQLGNWNVLQEYHRKELEFVEKANNIILIMLKFFFYQETWFWNCRFGWREEAFLFRC